MDIDKLTQKVANHIATRPVVIRWENPPSNTAVGQCFKTADGKVVVYVGHLTGAKSRLQTLVHECLHGRYDFDILPLWNSRNLKLSKIKSSDAERRQWRESTREMRTKATTSELMDYAERNAYKHWRTGRDWMTMKLLALLDWEG